MGETGTLRERLEAEAESLDARYMAAPDLLREAAAALYAMERTSVALAKVAMTPERVEALRDDCHADYNGGHRSTECIEAFHHGMDTVCNVLAAWVATPGPAGAQGGEDG